MIRFPLPLEGRGVMNGKKHLEGRGFYLCPDLACFKMAQKKNSWVRSLDSKELQFFQGKKPSVDECFVMEEEGE